ncbi:MAG: ATP-binding protein [Desulfonatronovibrionaceae bacterium]
MRLCFRYSLLQALLVYVIVPLVMALAVAGYAYLTTVEKRAEERMQEEVQLVARALKLPVSHALKRDREGSVYSALESAFQINRVYGASVYDADGNKVASVGAQETPVRNDGSQMAELAEEGDRQEKYGKVGGTEAYTYFLPLTEPGGQSIGLLRLSRKKSEFQEYIRHLRLEFAFILGAGALSMTLLVLFGHRRALGRHLDNLSRSMRRVEKGDLKHRLHMRGPREISAVASAFNTMLDSLDRARQELDEQRKKQARLEDELRKAEKMAAIGRLASGVAHELGTPLSIVDGYAQRVRRLPALPDQIENSLEHIRNQVRRMESIVRQLLDFGRQNISNPRQVNPDQIARKAIQSVTMHTAHARKDIQFGSPGVECRLEGDPVRLEQLLVNLLKNSLQATSEGRVALKWDCDQKYCIFTIQDDGPGIDSGIRSRVCDPFFTTKAPGEGTGLGLAVVHGIVEEHNGDMYIGDSPWGGAEFVVRIPLYRGNYEADSAASEAPGKGTRLDPDCGNKEDANGQGV